MECDGSRVSSYAILAISTHALTWSATISSGLTPRRCIISTHALTWSATQFIPRHIFKFCISTHALTWSATCSPCVSFFIRKFQLTHSRGVRLNALVSPNVALLFQLTHSRGVRHDLAKSATDLENFNSRTHVECDGSTATKNGSSWNFNSRTHVECDVRYGRGGKAAVDFNSRTHVECDTNSKPKIRKFSKFQLTHSRGVRLR